MTRFVVGEDRNQSTLFPERVDEYVDEDNPVRVIDVFVDELDLAGLGFSGVEPHATGRPSYHPATLLKIYVYGYLNRIQSSRRLERECRRNIELIWLTGRLMPDFKTIADFRKNNGKAIGKVCREFVVLCQRIDLFSDASVAVDGSKFVLAKPSSAWTRSIRGTGTSRVPRWPGAWNRLTRVSPATSPSWIARIARAPRCRKPGSRGLTRRLRP
jgi:transposase